MSLLNVNLTDNLAYYGFDVVTLAPMEAEFLFALNAKAPLTASYDDLSKAIWGKRLPDGTLRMLASTAARLRVKIAPWDYAILCHSRIGYRLIHDPAHAGIRSWRGDEELLLCKLAAEGMSAAEMVAHLPRHDVKAIRGKLCRLKRGSGMKRILARAA